MFADIRRHQKWLWILISGAVIVSFVWYFNPNQRNGGRGIGFESSVGTLNGKPISRTAYLNARKEAELRYLFNYGSWHGSDEFSRQNPNFIENETRNRLILKEKLNEMNVHATPDDVAKWITEAFSTREKGFSTADYDRFVSETLKQHGITEEDLERYVRGELGIMHLVQVAGTPGKLVTPQAAEAQYRRENEGVSADAVFFSATNFVSQVNLDPSAISGFYTNQKAMYRVPDKVRLAYVAFPASNYLATADQKLGAVTNLAAEIDRIYLQRGPKYYTDTNDIPLAPEVAKAKIKEEQRKQIALVEARKAATQFETELLELTSTNAMKSVATLENLAAAKGLVAKTTEPFAQYESPKGLELPERFSQAAFLLSPGEPFIEEPVVGDDAVYVFGLKQKIGSDIPPLDAIREKVLEDYKRFQSQKLATDAGQAFLAKLTNAIASGKTFSAAAAELGQKPVNLAPFTQMSRVIVGLDPRTDPSSIKSVAFSLKEGETSPFTRSRDGGFILHVNKIIPAPDDQVKAALPAYLANLQRSGQSEAFQEWFSKEFKGAKVTLVTDKSNKGGAQGDNEPQEQ